MRISDWSSDVCSSDLKASRTIAWSTAANAVEGLCATASCSAIVRHTVNSLTSLSGSGFTISSSASSSSLDAVPTGATAGPRSEEHTSELQSLMRLSYAVFCLHKKKTQNELTSTYK